jgi:hypothetical protein
MVAVPTCVSRLSVISMSHGCVSVVARSAGTSAVETGPLMTSFYSEFVAGGRGAGA